MCPLYRKGILSRLREFTLFFAAVSIGGLAILVLPAVGKAQPSKKGGGPPAALIEVSTVFEKEVDKRITLVGIAQPWMETVIASEEEGLVRITLVDEGEKIVKDQILCKQNSTQLALTIKAAKAALAEAEVLKEQARREFERQKRLFSIESVSEKTYDDARFEADASEKRVARLYAELRSLEDRLDKKVIRAPISGYVAKRHALIGQWLGEGDPVVTMVVLDPIRVMVPVPERYISGIDTGVLAQVTFDALPGRTFSGAVAAVIPRADEAARTFPVRIELSNKEAIIKGGMLSRVSLPVGDSHLALLVPKDALVLSGSRKAVYVVNNNSVYFVPVKTSPAFGSFLEVNGNLKAGQKVVVRGNERLRPGQAVQIIEKNEP